tara:strand:+ start:1361 stop:2212 length:852 start_codon:yes stop_codon:yes gene_type:complete
MSEKKPITSAKSQRIAMAIEYDGSVFSGWQRQLSPNLATVQGAIEKALSQVAGEVVVTHCAGRTDAGVHASCQVLHFDTKIDRGSKAWFMGVNSLLPKAVRVVWSRKVTENFHARFSATARRYCYVIYTANVASAILDSKVTHSYQELNSDAMDQGAQLLLGELDFSSFRAAGCQSKTPYRFVRHARVVKQGPFLIFDIKANAFLQHMVRNIAGALLEIGKGKRRPSWISELILAKDRKAAGIAAPPHGLYLIAIDYPKEHGLPVSYRLPLFLNINKGWGMPN